MTYRRRMRWTRQIAAWAEARLQRPDGAPPRVTATELEPVVLAIFRAGVRRGRAEVAAELGARLGLAAELELGELELPPIRISLVSRDPAAPEYVARERTPARRSRPGKP